ncbi:MAG: ATP/GTP-binding protein [Archaeoglobaceae archaeon]
MQIVVLGPGGSGKSTFVMEFSNFLRHQGYDVKCVNLDPASEPIYKADIDVRNFIKIEDVMRTYKLGINGAMLKSVELMLEFCERLKLDGEFVLYDTPGQMELFIYSESGVEFVNRIKDSHTCGVFLIDANMVKTPENFLSAVLQDLVVMLRLGLQTLTVISKTDLCDIDIKSLLNEISKRTGILSEVLEKLSPLIDYTSLRYKTIKISSVKKTGFNDLLSALRELFCACGDLS